MGRCGVRLAPVRGYGRVAGARSMVSEPRVRCDFTGDHGVVVAWSVVFILFFVVGFLGS